jgi:D-alanyl-D-alanine carboxypeptidase
VARAAAFVLMAALLLAGCGGGGGGAEPLGERLQQALDHERAAQHIPGAAAAVVQNGRVVWVGASGLADVDAGRRVHADTEFAIASVTKPFVAQRVVALADAGVLSLDDPLSRWLPRFPGARGITLRQLLSHTAGLDDYVTNGRFLAAERRRGPEYQWTPQQLLRYIPSPLAAPGERYSYSNADYLLLGLVIERATRKRLDTQLPPAFVFQPRERPGADAAVGYLDGQASPDNPYLPSRETASTAWGSGNLVATAGDLAQAGDALLRAAPKRGMTQWVPAIGDAQEYGLGLMRIRLAGQEAWGHSGDIDGFHADLWYLPARDTTVAALINRNITTDRRGLVEALAQGATT